MDFLTDLITCLTSDTSTNSWATGDIQYNHLPINFDKTKNWIVFWYSGNSIDTMGYKAVYSEYELNIQLISEDLDSIINIFNTLNEYLLVYKTNELEFILSEDSDPEFNLEKAVYFKTIKYRVLY